MTQRENDQPDRPSPEPGALTEVIKQLHSESDAYQFETLWSAGLSASRDVTDRDRVLEVAGQRLDDFDDEGRGLSRAWLRHVVNEIRSRGGEPPSPSLAALASRVVREAFARSSDDLASLREARSGGLDERRFARDYPRLAASIRDLGRLARGFRGTGMLALADRSMVDEAVAFADALTRPKDHPIPTVAEWLRISRDELLQWASSGAASDLPRLLRRLVAETTPSASRIRFPGGTGVASGGWDGLVDNEEATIFVPGGRSGWELSVNKSSNKKAEDDYEKRSGEIPPTERAAITYVAVSCRQWTGAEEFARSKSALGEFRDVLAHNVDDIESWLEQAPATTIWLRELLGKPVDGVRTMADWWARWLGSTTVPLDEDVVLAGRDSQVEDLRAALQHRAIVTIGGDVRRDEILAFVGAATASPAARRDVGGGEVLFVDDSAVASRLLGPPGELTVVVPTPELAQELPTDSSHHLIVPIPGSEQADIVLPPVDSKAASDRLEQLGESFGSAQDLGALARRSLLALRRYLATNRDLYRPDWADGAIGVPLRRSLLLNRWNESWSGDREIVERISGQAYAAFSEDVRRIAASADDPPLAMIDERWHVVSPADAWLLVGNQLTTDDLEAFRAPAIEVLGHVDPLAWLSGEERLRASLEGAKRKYSADLGRGFASTLALLGSLDPRIHGTATSGASFADSVVRALVVLASDDPSFKTWAALAPHLPLLAEAAPEVLLEGFQRGLSGNAPLLGSMFQDRESSDFGSPQPSPHTHFLWALEVLAWSPDYLGPVVAILGALQDIDPGGQWANRPSSTLQSIMCPWHPNTAASADSRLGAVSRLRRQSGTVGWDLMVSMLPTGHGSQMIHTGPKYRDWKHGEPIVTNAELLQVTNFVASALIEDAGEDTARWTTLIGRAGDLPPEARNALVEALEQLDQRLEDESARAEIWDSIRAFVSRHREFSEARWALPASELVRFDPLVESFSPKSLVAQFEWLFENGLIHLDEAPRRDDHEAFDAALAERRAEAVQAILEAGGWDAVLEFVGQVENAGVIGVALAQVAQSQFEGPALALLAVEEPGTVEMALGYFGETFRDRGWEWLDEVVASHDLGPSVSANLLRVTWDPVRAWTRAEELGESVATEYWKRFGIYGLGHDFEQVLEVARRLQGVGRVGSALALLALYARRHESDQPFAEAVAAALEAAMGHDLEDRSEVGQHDFETLLEVLARHADDLGVGRVASIEWYYLPALGFDPEARTLHRALAEDPAFFVQMLELVYRPANEPSGETEEVSEEDRARASNAYRLLKSWQQSPGVDAEGRIDDRLLRDWVSSARGQLAEVDRVEVGDSSIGEALVASPPDPDGTWPSRPVRDLLEDLESDALDRGLELGIFNSRGVTSRSMDAGGAQERRLADDYRERSKRFAAQWPRTASVFSHLARSYEADAMREDQAAERRRRGLDH